MNPKSDGKRNIDFELVFENRTRRYREEIFLWETFDYKNQVNEFELFTKEVQSNVLGNFMNVNKKC
jgi:hypothetical protein